MSTRLTNLPLAGRDVAPRAPGAASMRRIRSVRPRHRKGGRRGSRPSFFKQASLRGRQIPSPACGSAPPEAGSSMAPKTAQTAKASGRVGRRTAMTALAVHQDAARAQVLLRVLKRFLGVKQPVVPEAGEVEAEVACVLSAFHERAQRQAPTFAAVLRKTEAALHEQMQGGGVGLNFNFAKGCGEAYRDDGTEAGSRDKRMYQSGYSLFCQDMLKAKGELGEMAAKERLSAVAGQWKNLPKEERARLNGKAAAGRKEARAERAQRARAAMVQSLQRPEAVSGHAKTKTMTSGVKASEASKIATTPRRAPRAKAPRARDRKQRVDRAMTPAKGRGRKRRLAEAFVDVEAAAGSGSGSENLDEYEQDGFVVMGDEGDGSGWTSDSSDEEREENDEDRGASEEEEEGEEEEEEEEKEDEEEEPQHQTPVRGGKSLMALVQRTKPVETAAEGAEWSSDEEEEDEEGKEAPAPKRLRRGKK